MAIALVAEPISFPFSSGWTGLLDAFASVRAAIRGRRPIGAAQALIIEAVERHASAVLAARDADDLFDRLLHIVHDQTFLTAEVNLARVVMPQRLPSGVQVEAAARTAFGETRLAKECARLTRARVEAAAQAPEFRAAAAQQHIQSDLLSRVLADFRTPTDLSVALFSVLAAEAATLALIAPLVDAKRWACPPWIRLELLEVVREGSLAHLKLLALVPGIVIPGDVLPATARLDAAKLERESEELARFVVPSRLLVEPAYAQRVLDLIEADDEPSAGVRALFSA